MPGALHAARGYSPDAYAPLLSQKNMCYCLIRLCLLGCVHGLPPQRYVHVAPATPGVWQAHMIHQGEDISMTARPVVFNAKIRNRILIRILVAASLVLIVMGLVLY